MTTSSAAGQPERVYLEIGQKRVFACATDWPGWCRSAKSEDLALEALTGYARRYALVAREAGLPFALEADRPFRVVERVSGSAGYTDYGVPGTVAGADRQPWRPEDAERHVALLEAAWKVFDLVAATAPPELRRGPRGGGRDRDRLVDHVLGAEASYARKLGVTHRQPARGDRGAVAALRGAIAAALRATKGSIPTGKTGWPPRSAVRRITWHVLDHAWEIEDRSRPAD